MKKQMLCLLLAACTVLLSACSLLPFGKKEADPGVLQLAVPVTQTYRSDAESVVTKFTREKVVKREDGLYEVFCRTRTEGSFKEGQVRFLYSADAVLLGERSISEEIGNQDSVHPFDTTWESYIAGREEEIDRIQDTRIYYTDGAYEDLEVDKKGRILRSTQYSPDGMKIMEISLSRFGQLFFIEIYNEDGSLQYSVQYTYDTVVP